jgi:transposase
MRYSFESRCRAVAAMREGQSPSAAAHAVGASRATGYRWWARYQAGGWAGLQERPSTPQRQPRRLSPAAEAEIGAAREHSGAGSLTLGALLGLPTSTVGKVLRRLGRSRLPREPRPPVVRYERARPGELVHIDTKKLGRFWHVGKRILRDGVQRSPRAGWQHVHVAVDDHSRLAYAEVLPSDRQRDALAFLERALRWFGEQGVAVEAVMTDNGPAYVSHAWRRRCAELGLPAPSLAGCGGTTDADPTARSAASRPSAVSHTSVVSTSSLPVSRTPTAAHRRARVPGTLGTAPCSMRTVGVRVTTPVGYWGRARPGAPAAA